MGASVIPIIGSIITSVIVSKAVAVIGEKIGLSEDLTGILSAAAGAYAGAATYNQAMGAATPGPAKAGMDLSAATAMPTAQPAMPPPVSNIPGTPLVPGGSPYTSPQSAGGGMLTQAPPPDLAGGGMPPPPGGTTANQVIESQTAGKAGEDSWWSKMFSPGKTMDLVMAGMQGYGEAGMRQYEVDRPYEVEKDRGRRWEEMGTSGFNQVTPTYPSQGG